MNALHDLEDVSPRMHPSQNYPVHFPRSQRFPKPSERPLLLHAVLLLLFCLPLLVPIAVLVVVLHVILIAVNIPLLILRLSLPF